MITTGHVQHPPDDQYDSSKPEIVNTTCEQRKTYSPMVYLQLGTHFQQQQFTHTFGYGHCPGVKLMIIRGK